MSNLTEAQEKLRRLQEEIKRKEEYIKREEELKNRDKDFDQFNDDILQYLRAKFPDESDVAIQEAAAFISYRTATIILEKQAEMNSTMVKFYGDTTRNTIEMIGGLMK